MAGKKKKKGPISKGVRVNTVTKEVKIETSPSHSSISSSSRVVESLEDEIMQVGYLKLFQRNPNYNIIFIDSKTKQKLKLKHESLMRIFNLNNKILSQIPPYIIIQIISGEKNVEEFQSLEDIKKNQAFTNLFNFGILTPNTLSMLGIKADEKTLYFSSASCSNLFLISIISILEI